MNLNVDKRNDIIRINRLAKTAIDIFNEKQIAVVTGASGDASEAALAYAQGKLTSTGSVCNQHAHHEECGGH